MINDNKVRDMIYWCIKNTQNSWIFAKDSCGTFEDKWRWKNLHVNELLYSIYMLVISFSYFFLSIRHTHGLKIDKYGYIGTWILEIYKKYR